MPLTRLTVLVAIVCCLTAMAFGQAEPAFELDHSFGGGTGTLWIADLASLNRALDVAGYPTLSDAMLLFGQTTTIGFADGPRLGFVALTGAASSEDAERRARLSFAFMGGVAEWGMSTSTNHGIAVGLMFGGGNSSLTLVDHTPPSFQDALIVPFRAKLDRWLYAIEPSIVTYGDVIPGVSLRVRAGYLFTIGCRWKAEEIAYEYPFGGFGGPTAEVSVALNLGELLEELLGKLDEAKTPPDTAP